MFTAFWNDVELARGTDVIAVEGRLYFRRDDVLHRHLTPAPDRSICEWKGGEAEYFDIVAGGQVNRAAAWSYPSLGQQARAIEGRIAFWKDVAVGWAGPGPAPVPGRIDAKTPNVAKALGAADVVWQPKLGAILGPDAAGEVFAGYLIASLRVIVDVMATPPEPERPARIAEGMRRAQAVAAWNAAHPDAAHGYIAVWGSATPAAADIESLRCHAVLLALTAPSLVISGGRA